MKDILGMAALVALIVGTLIVVAPLMQPPSPDQQIKLIQRKD